MIERNEEDDRDLLKKAQEGDAEAFGQLYLIYAQAVFGFLYAHLDNRLDAEDLTEEVFVRAWRSLSRYKQQGTAFLAYLFQIARNALIDKYRRSKHTESDLALDTSVIPDTKQDPSELAAIRMEHTELRQVIGKLPLDYQTVLTLRFLSGLSPEETAQAMGRSGGAIRVLQHRALAALRDRLNHR